MTKLLIIATQQLPGVVHALQAAACFKNQGSDIGITIMVRDELAPFVRLSTAVDEVLVFKRYGGVFEAIRLMRQVRLVEYDYVFDMQGLLRSGLMTWFSKSKRKVGRADALEHAGVFYHECVQMGDQGRGSHDLRILLQFAPQLGLRPERPGPLVFREPENLNLNHIMGANGSAPIVMFPDSRYADRRWQGFKELTEFIVRDGTGRKVVWAGHRYVDFKDAPSSAQFANLTDSTSLVALPALVKRAAWVIANDSGPLHLASALGIPTLGIFGPTDPQSHGPYPLAAPMNHAVVAPVGNLRLLAPREVYNRFVKLDGGRPRGGPFMVRGF